MASSLAVASAPPASGVPSADGAAIVFTVTSGGVSSLWTMNPDGTNAVEIPGQPAASNTLPGVSPDGTKVAFTSTPAGGTSDVWVMNVAGGGLTRLTTDPGNDSNPSWASVGARIAFQSDRAGNMDVWLMNPDGSGQTKLSNSSALDSSPAWFPGLRRLAFVSTRSGHAEIWAENANGTGLLRITNTSYADTQPTVDPAGKYIAFTSRHGSNTDVYRVPVNGGTISHLTSRLSIESEPAFSTDGRFITFTSDRFGPPQVCEMPLPTGPVVALTHVTEPDTAGQSEWIPYTYPAPAWASRYGGTATKAAEPFATAVSPDGSKVFVAGTMVNLNTGYGVGGYVVAYDSSGTELWRHTYAGEAGQGAAFDVAVSPNGNNVYVTGWSDRNLYVAAYAASTGTIINEYTVNYAYYSSGYALAVSSDSQFVYLTGTALDSNGTPYSITTALNPSLNGVKWYDKTLGGDPATGALAINPDGKTLYWTGIKHGTPYDDARRNDYLTSAIDTADGSLNWSKTYNGPGNGEDDPWGLAVSPDGSSVYVTGYSVGGSATKGDQATLAYTSSFGVQQWVNRFDSPNHGSDEGVGIAVSPDGSWVYTAGDSSRDVGSKITRDFLATSINASDGLLHWSAFYNGPGDYTGTGYGDAALNANLSPDGNTLYVSGTSYRTGTSFDLTSVGYDTSGKQVWLARYDGPANGEDDIGDVALSPDGSRLYVTGISLGTNWDSATVAWDTSSCGPCSAAENGFSRSGGDAWGRPGRVLRLPRRGSIYSRVHVSIQGHPVRHL